LHDNKNFFAYGQPISAMASGKVVAAIDVYPPNFGQKTNPASLLNYILIEHDPHGGPNHFFHGYYHVHQFANQVSEGDQVSAGQALGKIGNAGGSSEPHLHIGLVEYDATGNGTLVPVAYSGLRQGDKQLPDDIVPATAQYTS
jgi:murein DD-endopeptidase MepM/ murein hydrolase activator NlpD